MTLPPPPPEPPGPLLTRADLAVLSALHGTDRDRAPASASALTPWEDLAPFMPTEAPKLAGRLGRLLRVGLVDRTDTGGPKSKARTLWRLTPAGASTLDGYAREHPRRPS